MKRVKKRTWAYVVAALLAVVFNTLYAAWPTFEAQLDGTVWAVVNVVLGIIVGLIRVAGAIIGLPASVEDVEEDKDSD